MKNWYIVPSHSSVVNKVAGLIKVEADKAKISEKLNFAIREGGRTVGAGVVTKIIE